MNAVRAGKSPKGPGKGAFGGCMSSAGAPPPSWSHAGGQAGWKGQGKGSFSYKGGKNRGGKGPGLFSLDGACSFLINQAQQASASWGPPGFSVPGCGLLPSAPPTTVANQFEELEVSDHEQTDADDIECSTCLSEDFPELSVQGCAQQGCCQLNFSVFRDL